MDMTLPCAARGAVSSYLRASIVWVGRSRSNARSSSQGPLADTQRRSAAQAGPPAVGANSPAAAAAAAPAAAAAAAAVAAPGAAVAEEAPRAQPVPAPPRARRRTARVGPRSPAVAAPEGAAEAATATAADGQHTEQQRSTAGKASAVEAPAVVAYHNRQPNRDGRVTVSMTGAGPQLVVTKPLPRVLILHTGGTLGMDIHQSFEENADGSPKLREGTGGTYGTALQPGDMLSNLFSVVPELTAFANIDLKVVFNKDSSRVGPREWVQIARQLHTARAAYDAFMVVHGTDTMAYTASALSLMLQNFGKPIVLTGSQLPLSMARSDARQNLIDSLTCATAAFAPPHVTLHEVAICFGGKLMRGNRAQKVNSNSYQAFDSPGYPGLATLGVNVDWNERYLLRVEGSYRPRFDLDPAVIRVPIVPGSDPRLSYGDLMARGVHGVVLEAFGVGNMPDTAAAGWLPWLRDQTKKGLQVYLSSQCNQGSLHPELYRSGSVALQMGVQAGPQMTPECSVVKMMLCLMYKDIPLTVPLAGEL